MTDGTADLQDVPAACVPGPKDTERLPLRPVALYVAGTILYILSVWLIFGNDYVGRDNDDAMRLVEVRDLLAGQGWFDMMQYRLGLAGGTPMHWSRFVDLPIANLIDFFGLFLPKERAEAAALAAWPLMLIAPFLLGIGLAAFRLGGRSAMHAALVLAAIYVIAVGRFRPGAIDHHNVQLAIVALLTAMLLDARHRGRSYALAGILCGLAIAIGAETTPLIGVICIVTAFRWACHGMAFRRAATAFGLAFAATTSFAFFATVPPSHYGQVTCDSLSYGFYALATFGGSALFLVAAVASGWSVRMRLLALAGTGAVLSLAVLVIAPQCLRSPLADLDPMLNTFWLSGVVEAQSVFSQWRGNPVPIGGFYMPGLIAMAVCLYRARRRQQADAYLALLPLLAVSFAISLIQVRGYVFTNLLAMPPLAAAIVDLRRRANADTKNWRLGLGFAAFTLASVPPAWALAGFLVSKVTTTEKPAAETVSEDDAAACDSRASLLALAAEPTGVVAAATDLGTDILRFTGHRVLSAPYHRNQGGMLTEMHIGLSEPHQAEAFLRGAGVTLLAFCPSDPGVRSLVRAEPGGLYAELTSGNVPDYLEPVDNGASRLRIYRVRAAQ
ncbi:hypothetical protein [Mycoplana sp. MJR14]|uniref:hypothetical protein n=1 Tax=Mycoplana sp. MJR14 TaxID=3032583 RepID=UPI0023DA358F|nr:hypothetical protein [Mycoplana sp. MJR14]MDF1634214.1 hypothetical protein [Mycoplana sp. MJR14]